MGANVIIREFLVMAMRVQESFFFLDRICMQEAGIFLKFFWALHVVAKETISFVAHY